MTENEIKEATLEDAIYCAKGFVGLEGCEECRFYGLCHTWCDDVYRIIVDALEEIQAYRAIGTVEVFERAKEISKENFMLCMEYKAKVKQYEAIGTVEELQALKEKNVAKKAIAVDSGVYDYPYDYECPNCRENVDELDHHCNCGQALDWQ